MRFLSTLLADEVLELAFAVKEAEEVRPAAEFAELLVAAPVEHGLGVGDVGRIGYLHARDAEHRIRWP